MKTDTSLEKLQKLEDLVRRFKSDEANLISSASTFSETEARIEYIDPFFELLGWDVDNSDGVANALKDVVREESLPNEKASKRPDYTFRIVAIKKFLVEAKRSSVDIRRHRNSAFQIRSYGYTVGLPVSILTNFRTFRVYDTRLAPNAGDGPDVGLIMSVDFEDLPAQLPDLIARFGRDEVAAGSIDRYFGVVPTGTIPVSVAFLERINRWRLRIAQDLYDRYRLADEELNDLAQKVINRIIFIRMCEDRGIEGEERLRNVARKLNFVELRTLFRKLDNRYNTGLFDVTTDSLQTSYEVDAALFLDIVNEVYAPNSPYSFSVLDADFLGQVYEMFLVKRLAIDPTGLIVLEDKPAYEGREIVTTPQPLVDEVVRRAFAGKLASLAGSGTLSKADIESLRVMDIAVGSGRFLLRAMDELVDTVITLLPPTHPDIYRASSTEVRLRFEAKRSLLQECLFGIDIDYNAIEVARFSLMVKLLEDETADTLPSGRKILPNLDKNLKWGNSVVGTEFPTTSGPTFDLTHPFDWTTAGLPTAIDIVIGNPPYIKTEDMKVHNDEEMQYFKRTYETPYRQFDKYFVFIEQALRHLKADGWFGMVVPNKWMTIVAGEKLRGVLAKNGNVAEIVDFGSELLFEGKSTYVCLLVLSQRPMTKLIYRYVHAYPEFIRSPNEKGHGLTMAFLRGFGKRAWVLPANANEAVVLSKLVTNSEPLSEIADVKNGIQTSANDVFLIENYNRSSTTALIEFVRDGAKWKIEAGITRPYINDSSRVVSYQSITADALMIFPYEPGISGTPSLIPPAELARKYPLAWRYLKHYKARLKKRDVSPPPPTGVFYAYGRHQALEAVFLTPKIVYSVNQVGGKYGIDSVGVAYASGGTAGEVAIVNPRKGYALEFILALLNQRAIEFFVRKRGSAFRGGYFARGSAVIDDVPVPKLDLVVNTTHSAVHDAIVNDAKQLIGVQSKLLTASGRARYTLETKKAALVASLDSRFKSLWGMTYEVDSLVLPGES